MNAKKRRFIVGGILAATFAFQSISAFAETRALPAFNATFNNASGNKAFNGTKVNGLVVTKVNVSTVTGSSPGATVTFSARANNINSNEKVVSGKETFDLKYTVPPVNGTNVVLYVYSPGNVIGTGGTWAP